MKNKDFCDVYIQSMGNNNKIIISFTIDKFIPIYVIKYINIYIYILKHVNMDDMNDLDR